MKHQDCSPWLGVVVKLKKAHPCKGYWAVVLDIWLERSTPSSLEVEVRFEAYDPNVPNPKAIFDYDDLVEDKYVFFATMSPFRS